MLKTENLNIELLSNNHSAHLLNYYKKNKEHLEKWEPKRDSSFYTASFFKRLIIKRLKEIQKGQSVRFVIIPNESNTIIGVCNYTIEFDMKCHLGYSISEEYEGKGLMYEALLKTNQYEAERKITLAVSSLYGIDILNDNVITTRRTY